jgi:hypothetical protein
MSSAASVTKLVFEGAGKYVVKKTGVSCSIPFKVVKNGSSLTIRSTRSASGGSSSSSIVMDGFSLVGCGGNISATAGEFVMNGITYTPHVPTTGRYKGQEIMLPVGYNSEGGTEVKATEEEEEGSKEYAFACPVSVKDVNVSGQCNVKIYKGGVISTHSLLVQCSGQGVLTLSPGLEVASRLSVHTSGQSLFDGGDVVGSYLIAQSSGQSDIKNACGEDSVDASASGQSTCIVQARRGAAITKSKSGQSTLDVRRV